MNFSNVRILNKLMLLVGLLSLFIAGVVAVGIYGVKTFNAETLAVAERGIDSSMGELIQQHVVALNRAEFRVAADPSPETIAAAMQEVDRREAELRSLLAKARETADAEQTTRPDALGKALDSYLPQLDAMMATARQLGPKVITDDARRQIIKVAVESRDEADIADQAAESYSQISKSEMEDELKSAGRLGEELDVTMLVTAVLGIVAGLATGYLMAALAIARPISRSVVRLKKLSDGDTDTEIEGLGRKDEIGDIAATMQVFRENLIRTREMQAREAEAQAAQLRRAEQIRQLTEVFDRSSSTALKTVAAAATELQATASAMTSTAEETARQAGVVSAASEETTANVQTVASATEELSASIQEITTQVSESTRVVGAAVSEANQTRQEVSGLSEAAQKIGDVVRIISEIAAQTNLLALNATIEAARAGEAGKGFAVVASEVKTLATQTAKATDEITDQVRAIQEATGRSAKAIQGIAGTIDRVNEISTAIASAVEEQGAATQEISRNVQQAAQGTQEVSSNIVSVSTAAEHTGTAAAQVLEASGELAHQAEVIRTEVERYIAGVKAA